MTIFSMVMLVIGLLIVLVTVEVNQTSGQKTSSAKTHAVSTAVPTPVDTPLATSTPVVKPSAAWLTDRQAIANQYCDGNLSGNSVFAYDISTDYVDRKTTTAKCGWKHEVWSAMPDHNRAYIQVPQTEVRVKFILADPAPAGVSL